MTLRYGHRWAPESLRTLRIRLCGLALVGLASTVCAQDDDVLELSLEDLVDVTIASTIALGIHHTHPHGELMLGYSYMPMSMSGLQDGTERLSSADLFSRGYMVAPTSMDMNMHMFEVMYGLTDDLSIMAMLPYHDLNMEHRSSGGMQFSTSAEGLGDLSLSALYTFYRKHPHRLHTTFSLSVPTGSIDERDDTPMGPDQKLPYPMQLGSGTYDPSVGLTYLGSSGPWSWGAHSLLQYRLGKNDNDYRLGNRYQFDAWVSRKMGQRWSAYSRLDAITTTDIHGSDPDLNPMMVPTADASLRSATRINLRIGASIFLPETILAGSRLGLELGIPAHQSFDGPQLRPDWTANLSLQWVR